MDDFEERRRQYDRSPDLVQAVKVLTLMPDEVRSIVSEGIMAMMQQEYEQAMKERNFRSLGSYKVMSLFKTKNRRRDYDENAILHNAISRLYILSDETQDAIGRHIKDLLKFIQTYMEDCAELQQDVSMEDVAEITTQYVEKGAEEVGNFLNQLQQEFNLSLHGRPKAEEKSQNHHQFDELASNKGGMKVKLDLE